MSVADLLDKLDDLIDEAWNLPLSGGKTVVDAEKIREIVDDIRINIPQEMRQAKAIVADRSQIIRDAKEEADGIVKSASERAKVLVSRDEIVKNAQKKANDILNKANIKSKEIRKAANDYVDDIIKRTEDSIQMSLTEIRDARKNVKSVTKIK